MKKDVIKNVLVISLSVLIVGLSGYIVYDKLFSNNDVNNTNNDDYVYSYNDFSETVFSDDSGNNYLILWKNGTYSYNNTIGNYIVDNNNIILNYIFDNGNVVNEEIQIKLVIKSLIELEDTIANVKLNKVNHPTSSGGNDFYSNINNSGSRINNHVGTWYMYEDSEVTQLTIKNKSNSSTEYLLDIRVHHEADYNDLKLYCYQNTAACSASSDDGHSFILVMAIDQIVVIPNYGTAGYWIFPFKK